MGLRMLALRGQQCVPRRCRHTPLHSSCVLARSCLRAHRCLHVSEPAVPKTLVCKLWCLPEGHSALRPHNPRPTQPPSRPAPSPCPTQPSSRPAQINSRRINDELNVFKDIHRSPIFIGVLIVTAGLQVRDARRRACCRPDALCASSHSGPHSHTQVHGVAQ